MPPKFIPRDCLECGAALVPGQNAQNRCSRCYFKHYHRANKARRNAEAAARRRDNPEYMRLYLRGYRAAHPLQMRAYEAKYRAAHPEQERKRAKAYRTSHQAQRAAYGAAHPEHAREKQHRRQVRKRSGFVARVRLAAIYQRDGGICQICLKPVERKLASLDHILPIARGGTHEPRNVRITHRLCNVRRQHRGAAQLRLLG